MSRSYKRIRRDNERQFPHQVRLTHARLWRMDHWNVPPEQQADRPPAPPEDKRQLYGPINMMG
jgi:hypothetical protein